MSSRQAGLRGYLVSAIRKSISKAGTLRGFALCTDDDVMSVFHVYLSVDREALEAELNPNIRFEFWEWSESSSEEDMGLVSTSLRAWADEDASVAGSDARFQVLVDALAECRSDGVCGAQTFLCVSSTDPDEHSQRLAASAVRRLNGERAASEFLEYVGWTA